MPEIHSPDWQTLALSLAKRVNGHETDNRQKDLEKLDFRERDSASDEGEVAGGERRGHVGGEVHGHKFGMMRFVIEVVVVVIVHGNRVSSR
ncbi:unnamed protein product [Camellia sinensis]